MKNTKFNKIITGIAIIASLVCGSGRKAEAGGAAEITAGDKSATFDLKINVALAPRTNLFLRNRVTADYKNNVDYFGVVDLDVNLVGGLDAVVEGQVAPAMGIVPRTGVQYFKKIKDVALYGIGTCSIKGNPDGELLLNVGYNPALVGDLKLLTNLENITNVGAQGHNFSIQRLRLGLDIKGYGFGTAADFTEAGNKGNFTYNVGGFVSKKF